MLQVHKIMYTKYDNSALYVECDCFYISTMPQDHSTVQPNVNVLVHYVVLKTMDMAQS